MTLPLLDTMTTSRTALNWNDYAADENKNKTDLFLSSTFTAQDCRLFVILPGAAELPPLAELTTALAIRAESFRATPLARPIGYVNPKGFARATRTVAGSLVSVFNNRDVFHRLVTILDKTDLSLENEYFNFDQLPPFHLMVVASNEYGAGGFRIIRNIQFTQEEIENHSLNTPEQNVYVMSFLATDFTPFIPFSSVNPNEVHDGKAHPGTREVDPSYFSRIFGGESQGKVTYESIVKDRFRTMFDNFNNNVS